MDFNIFDWIRNGVKRSVLLGVSDAVHTMGMPPDDEGTRDQLLGFLQDENASKTSRRRLSSSSNSSGQKKLGRSMSDIQAAKEAS